MQCGWREHVPCGGDIASARMLQPAEGQAHVCAECGHRYSLDEPLPPIQGFWDRVEAGGIVPSGECPECGGLCYLEGKGLSARDTGPAREAAERPPTRIVIQVRGGVVQEVRCSVPGADISVADWDDAERDGAARRNCERLEEEAGKLHGVY